MDGRTADKKKKRALTPSRALSRVLGNARKRLPGHVPFTSNTFCPRLWNRVFVSADASVYTCCRHVPIPPLGNLKKKSLREIWNDRGAHLWRWVSAHGGLPCFDHCHLLSPEERAVAYDPETHPVNAPYEGLSGATLLFGELCNISCIMCGQNHRSGTVLPFEVVRDRIDWSPVETINFQGGEPLAMKDCKESFVYLTEREHKKVNFLTNGTLVNEQWAERIAMGSTRVIISLNATSRQVHERVNRGSSWDKVIRNVGRLNEARTRLGSPLKLTAHFTVVDDNIQELPGFAGLAAELGFDEVNYGFDNNIPARLARDERLKAELGERTREELARTAIEVDRKILNELGLL